jgi:hypothetical protein
VYTCMYYAHCIVGRFSLQPFVNVFLLASRPNFHKNGDQVFLIEHSQYEFYVHSSEHESSMKWYLTTRDAYSGLLLANEMLKHCSQSD